MPTLVDPSRLRHSRDALSHSVSREAWRRAFEVQSADATAAISLCVGLAAAVVLVSFGLTGHVALAGFAVLGALSTAFSRYEPLRRTAEKVGFVGALVVASVLTGGVVALVVPAPAMQIGLVAAFAGVAAVLLAAFRVGGPGPVILVFAAAAGVGSTADPTDLTRAVAAAAVGAAVGFVIALLPFAFLPWGPARLAVARALAAVAAVPGGGSVATAEAAIAAAREKIALTVDESDDAHRHDLAVLLRQADIAVDEWCSGDGARLTEIVRHEGELRKIKQHRALVETSGEPVDLPRPAGFVAAGIAGLRTRIVLHHGARIAAASALAGWFAAAVGLGYPLWASMGAMAAMQGVTYGVTVQRAIQRLLGNAGGALVAAAVIAASFDYWTTVVVIVLLQITAEVTATRSYALCSLAVTPMALLVVGLGVQVGPEIGLSRVGDTLIGVVVGVVIAAVTVSVSDRAHVPTQSSACPERVPVKPFA